MKKSIIVPENDKPAMIAPPRPRQRGFERVIGIRPIIVANDVRAIGSSRLEAASATASI